MNVNHKISEVFERKKDRISDEVMGVSEERMKNKKLLCLSLL